LSYMCNLMYIIIGISYRYTVTVHTSSINNGVWCVAALLDHSDPGQPLVHTGAPMVTHVDHKGGCRPVLANEGLIVI